MHKHETCVCILFPGPKCAKNQEACGYCCDIESMTTIPPKPSVPLNCQNQHNFGELAVQIHRRFCKDQTPNACERFIKRYRTPHNAPMYLNALPCSSQAPLVGWYPWCLPREKRKGWFTGTKRMSSWSL